MFDRLGPLPRVGAIIYGRSGAPERLVADFAADLVRRGFRVGGVLQRTGFDSDGGKASMDLVEIDSGRVVSIMQDLGQGSAACSLDLGGVAEASGAARRAIAARADLVLINKFAKLERVGDGLAAELLAAMAEGVPLLTAVSGELVEDWLTMTGGRGDLLMPDLAALWRWWGPHHLYRDLAAGVAPGPVRRVVAGPRWILVEGQSGAGLARNPGTPDEMASLVGKIDRTGLDLRQLAEWITHTDAAAAAVGAAAIAAHYNRFDLEPGPGDPWRWLADCSAPASVGRGLGRRAGLRLSDRPGPGDYPLQAAPWLVPAADGVLLGSSLLADRTLSAMLAMRDPGACVVLAGPGAPVTGRLHVYGIDAVAGWVATAPDQVAALVAAGAPMAAIRAQCRPVNLCR